MAYAAPNPTPYASNLYPINTRILAIKRGDGSTAGGGTATAVGSYLAENCAIVRPGAMIDRKGIYGQGKGEPRIVRNPQTWSSKVQIDSGTTTNTIIPGDFFEEIVSIGADGSTTGTISVLATRFIIHSCNKDETAGNPHTYNLEAVEDMVHSAQYGGS